MDESNNKTAPDEQDQQQLLLINDVLERQKQRLESGKATVNEIRTEWGLPWLPCELAGKKLKKFD